MSFHTQGLCAYLDIRMVLDCLLMSCLFQCFSNMAEKLLEGVEVAMIMRGTKWGRVLQGYSFK